MSLAAFQELFCRMVASAELRRQLAEQPALLDERDDLDAREKRRLRALAADAGMRVNSAIHRANRIGPLDQTLPMTLFLLGERLGPLLARYWAEHPTENLQLPAESARFAGFVTAALRDGSLVDPLIEEVMGFERVCTELRFHGPQALRERLPVQGSLPPQVRVLRFHHDPEALLDALAALQPPPAVLAEGEFYLAVDARDGEPEFKLLDTATARSLLGLPAPDALH